MTLDKRICIIGLSIEESMPACELPKKEVALSDGHRYLNWPLLIGAMYRWLSFAFVFRCFASWTDLD